MCNVESFVSFQASAVAQLRSLLACGMASLELVPDVLRQCSGLISGGETSGSIQLVMQYHILGE
jgi:hypothetical protein